MPVIRLPPGIIGIIGIIVSYIMYTRSGIYLSGMKYLHHGVGIDDLSVRSVRYVENVLLIQVRNRKATVNTVA